MSGTDKFEKFSRIVAFGNFGPPLLAFSRSCADLGVEVYLLETTDKRPRWSKFSSALAGMETVSPTVVGRPEGIEAVKDYVRTTKADGLISVSDSNLLWLSIHRSEFEPDCKLLCPPYECLARIASKKYQIEIAKKAGFELLPTWYLKETADCDRIPENGFPVCVRPSDPTGVEPAFKARVLHSKSQLSTFLSSLQEIREPVIAQPFRDLPDLKVHGIRSQDGRILALEPFFVERKFEGVTLTLMRASFPPGTRAACERFAELAGLTGGFHFDLLYWPEEDRVFYLEVNARMGGVTDKAKAFGYDQPRLILEAYGHRRTRTGDRRVTARRRVVVKRAVLKHMIMAVTGRLTELDYPPVGRTRHLLLSIRDLVAARDAVFDPRDLRGTLWFMLQPP